MTIGYTIFMGKPVTSNGVNSYFGPLVHEVMHTVQFTAVLTATAAEYGGETLGWPAAWATWVVGMSPSLYHNVVGDDIYTPGPSDFYSQSLEFSREQL